MNTAAPPSIPSDSADTRQAVRAALRELLGMGLRVAAASARLADIEEAAADGLAKAAVAAVLVVERPDSLAAAAEIGHIADASEAARDLAATRLALVTGTFERAARAVRRTAALALRAEDTQPFRAVPGIHAHPRPPTPGHHGAGSEPDGERHEDLSERPDEPEDCDETFGRTTLEVLHAIRHDLRGATLAADARPAGRGPEPATAGYPATSSPARRSRRGRGARPATPHAMPRLPDG